MLYRVVVHQQILVSGSSNVRQSSDLVTTWRPTGHHEENNFEADEMRRYLAAYYQRQRQQRARGQAAQARTGPASNQQSK